MPLKVMVASTVYGFEDQIIQIGATLKAFGYEVWNSHLGTIPQHPGKSNIQNCVEAARNCDVFLGIIRPFYGSGVIGERSITHEEIREAILKKRPRWFLVHRDVICARQLLRPYMFKQGGGRTKFKLRKNPIIDDLRVIDIYHDAIQNEIPIERRVGHWVQEFYRLTDILQYIDDQFKDDGHISDVCEEMNQL